MTGNRLALLALGVVAIAVIAMLPSPVLKDRTAPLTWVATAHQFGPVGYRDPAGAQSPDGNWIAYSEGRFLRVRPIGGGPTVEFPPGDAQIRNLSWKSDSRTLVADGSQAGWAVYDRVAGTRQPLWPDRAPLTAAGGTTAKVADLKQLAWSPDGRSVAAIVNAREGQELWTIAADGSSATAARFTHRIASPAWTPKGIVACIETVDGHARVSIPCGGSPIRLDPDVDAYGPLAFSPDGRTVYAGLANATGTVDISALPASGGQARRLAYFSRDAYAPSVAADGSVLFKVQSYRTVVALTPVSGGVSRVLATFQSETPSWDPSGRRIGITYGAWRRVPDDAKYPDIAQDAGVIGADPERPATAPAQIVQDSASEDQSLCWSPNGKWVAFHSHKDQSDDVWLREAGGDRPARRVSALGRGAETGWPRWSPDGRWLLFDGGNASTHRSDAWVAGLNQDSGATTVPPQAIVITGLDAQISHAEWLPDSAHIVVLGDEGPGRHVIFTAPRAGGPAVVVYRFDSEHGASGLGVSPDGRQVAFVAPAPDGFFQIFRVAIAGGTPTQVTTDPSHKTQPAWSPDGNAMAFTVWNYDAQFWRLDVKK